MATAQRVTYLKARIEDKPGAFLSVMKELKAKNLGLGGGWAFLGEPGWAELYVIPRTPEKVKKLWKASSFLTEEGTAFFVKGIDRTGALLKVLEAVRHAGVNIIRTEGVAFGGKFGVFFLVAPADVDRMAKAIGAK